jgi:Mg2+ and Co2+ transporter CorA
MEHRITVLETRLDTIFPTLATKADLAALGSELQQSITVNMGELRIEMQRMNAEIKTWTLATVLATIGTMLAAIFGISQIYKATPPAAPIIITIPAGPATR